MREENITEEDEEDGAGRDLGKFLEAGEEGGCCLFVVGVFCVCWLL